jgi:hypothetical protein
MLLYLLCWNLQTFLWELKGTVQRDLSIVGRATLKMLRRKSKMQFLKQERNTQNAIALLNYLKCIAPQKLMLRT